MADVDVAVVGAGIAGLYLLHKLRGQGLSVRVLEAGTDLGGTWYWNRYPGARCDIESLQYSYSFSEELQQEWHWSERYATQAEILRYLNHVADRFGLRRDITFNARVRRAGWDERAGCWGLETESGARLTATFLVMATGALSHPSIPDIPGLERFDGPVYHTGRWPHGPVDLAGLDVAVIGTGSSGIQSIPAIAETARSVTVFQRTANFAVPAWNVPLAEEDERRCKAHYADFREKLRWTAGGYLVETMPEPLLAYPPATVEAELERRWRLGGLPFSHAYADTRVDRRANDVVAEFLRRKIRSIVRDGATAELLCPKGYPFGTKRLCVENGFFECFNRDEVRLVDLRASPITEVAGDGLWAGRQHHRFDAIVLATGFDAVTGALLAVDIRGRGGVSLRDIWADGPRSYLGLMVAGLPNLFTITGPLSPAILSNVLVSIEQHVEWIAGLMSHMQRRGEQRVEAIPGAQAAWVERAAALVTQTFYPEANSWYMGANIPGKPRVMLPFTGGVGVYRGICNEIAAKGYEGFALAT